MVDLCVYHSICGHLLSLLRHINIFANNTVLHHHVAVQVGYEKTAYTVTTRESEVEICIHVAKTPVPASFDVIIFTEDDSAGIMHKVMQVYTY